MTRVTKQQADARLEARCAELGLADARVPYRELLKALRARDAEAYARATAHYEQQVLPALGGAGDALAAWIDYGRVIGEMLGPGRMLTIDATGAARSWRPPLAAGEMVLYVLDDGARGSFVAASPIEPSAAQRATIGLLVESRLSL
jgi:hypothetical protein